MSGAHFSTDARRLLFDSYAEYVMRRAGVTVWDVFGSSSVGDNKWHDMVHLDFFTMRVMNLDLLDLICT